MKQIECEVYSRISGYMRPTRQWNRGKRSEFEERRYLKIPGEILKPEIISEKPLGNTQKAGIFDKIFNNMALEGL